MHHSMIRHVARLANETFDVLVVGAGIYGLTTAHALLQQGLTVALIDRGDLAGATSFNSLKTVHGGIRALQHGSLADTRQFIRERRAVATLAPHLVRVLPFVVPTALHPIRNRAALQLFLLAYDALAADRNAGLDPSVHLPSSYTVGARAALQLNPFIARRGVTGAAVWHDYQLVSPERYALAFARTITDAGGALANYVEATALLRDGNRIDGARALDTLSGASFDIRASLTINAAGPWAWHLLAGSGVPVAHRTGFSLALNLVLASPPLPRAIGGLSRNRFLFLVPWRDRAMLGTAHEGFHHDPSARPGPLEVEALLRETATAFPNLPRPAEAVRLVHRGLLPARASGAGHAALVKHSIVRDHQADGVTGLLSVLGVRYTTARATAVAAARAACTALGRRFIAAPPQPLAGSDFQGLQRYRAQHPAAERLVSRYGTLHSELPEDGRTPVARGTDVSRAEILYAVRNEMAVTLADVALRRTDLATAGHPGADPLSAAAAVMAEACGWDAARTGREIDALEQELAL
jgi:glycerol-3-phosphate dehydrogenase